MQQTGNSNWLHYTQQPSTTVSTRAPIGNIKVQNIITINAQSPNVVIESPSYNAKENVPPPPTVTTAPLRPMHNIYQNNAFDSSSYQFQPTQPNFSNGRKRTGLHHTSTDLNGALKARFDVDENNLPKSAKTSDSLFSSATHFRPISGLGEISPPSSDTCSLVAAETPKRIKLSDKSFDTKRELATNFGCLQENSAQKENICPDVKTEVKTESGLMCGGGSCYPKPPYSYSYLIILALKNSKNGYLPVTDIYTFVRRHYPYYETATDVWKNSIRHNLSLSKGFEKVARYNPEAPSSKKGCLWAMNPDKSPKVDEELSRYRTKDLQLILNSMRYPDKLDIIDSGCHGFGGVVDAFKSQYGMTNFGAYIRLYMREALLQEPCIQLDDDHWDSVSLPENPVSVNGMYVSHPQVNRHPEQLPPPAYTPGNARQPASLEAPIVIQQRTLPVLTKQNAFHSFPTSFIPQDYQRKDSNSYYHSQPILLKQRNLNSISTSKGMAVDENGLLKANSNIESAIVNGNLQNNFWSPPQLSSSVIRSSPFDDLTAHSANGHQDNAIANFGLSQFINPNSGSHSNSPHIANHSEASVAFLDSVAGLPVVPGCTPYGSPSVDFSSAVTPSNHHHLHESYHHQLNSGSNDFLSPFSNSASVGLGHGDSNEYLNYGEHLFESLNSNCYTGQ